MSNFEARLFLWVVVMLVRVGIGKGGKGREGKGRKKVWASCRYGASKLVPKHSSTQSID